MKYSIYRMKPDRYYIAPDGSFWYFLFAIKKDIGLIMSLIIPEFLRPLDWGETRIFTSLKEAKKYRDELETSDSSNIRKSEEA